MPITFVKCHPLRSATHMWKMTMIVLSPWIRIIGTYELFRRFTFARYGGAVFHAK